MTTKQTHTPGPWVYTPGIPATIKDQSWREPSVSLGGRMYVEVRGGYASPESDANARLIAAAPDLLAFAKQIADSGCYENPGEFPEAGESGHAPCLACQAAALVKKAEGGR